MIGAVREKERGSEEMLGMPSVLCCPVSSLAIAILRRSPREVASSRPLSGHGRRVSQFALAVRVCCNVSVVLVDVLCVMAALTCRVQYLNDIDPFAYTTNFPEPPRPPVHTFSATLPLINQLAAVHRLLRAPHRVSEKLHEVVPVILYLALHRCETWPFTLEGKTDCV